MGIFDKLFGKNQYNGANKAGAHRFIIGICVALAAGCGLFSKQSLDAERQNRELVDSVVALQQEIDALKGEKASLESEIVRINKTAAISEEAAEPIEVAFEKAMLGWSGNTQEGVDTICFYGDMWKAEMEEYLRLLEKELDDDKKQWLVSSQAKWEVFTKDNEELAWQTYDQMEHDGSIMQILSADIYYEKYKTRALYLKSLYDFLTVEH
jgi:cell division protein FtsB